MTRSPREADRRLCRPAAELTERHCSVKYSGATLTMQCRTGTANFNLMRFHIGTYIYNSTYTLPHSMVVVIFFENILDNAFLFHNKLL